MQMVHMKANLFFNFFLIVLTIFLMDAIREIFKYKKEEETLMTNKAAGELSNVENMMEFRAQRNFYITGMALFLWFVIRHLVLLISNTADLIDDCDALQKENDVLKKELETLVLKRASDDIEKPFTVEKQALLTDDMRSRSRSRPKKEL
jgi:B-cell receptor-associated protein 31